MKERFIRSTLPIQQALDIVQEEEWPLADCSLYAQNKIVEWNLQGQV